jgi:hypothetical protein
MKEQTLGSITFKKEKKYSCKHIRTRYHKNMFGCASKLDVGISW